MEIISVAGKFHVKYEVCNYPIKEVVLLHEIHVEEDEYFFDAMKAVIMVAMEKNISPIICQPWYPTRLTGTETELVFFLLRAGFIDHYPASGYFGAFDKKSKLHQWLDSPDEFPLSHKIKKDLVGFYRYYHKIRNEPFKHELSDEELLALKPFFRDHIFSLRSKKYDQVNMLSHYLPRKLASYESKVYNYYGKSMDYKMSKTGWDRWRTAIKYNLPFVPFNHFSHLRPYISEEQSLKFSREMDIIRARDALTHAISVSKSDFSEWSQVISLLNNEIMLEHAFDRAKQSGTVLSYLYLYLSDLNSDTPADMISKYLIIAKSLELQSQNWISRRYDLFMIVYNHLCSQGETLAFSYLTAIQAFQENKSTICDWICVCDQKIQKEMDFILSSIVNTGYPECGALSAEKRIALLLSVVQTDIHLTLSELCDGHQPSYPGIETPEQTRNLLITQKSNYPELDAVFDSWIGHVNAIMDFYKDNQIMTELHSREIASVKC